MKRPVLFVLAGLFAAALPPLAVSPAVAAETVVVDDGSVTIPPDARRANGVHLRARGL